MTNRLESEPKFTLELDEEYRHKVIIKIENFHSLPERFKNNKHFIMRLMNSISDKDKLFKILPTQLKDDKEFLLQVLKIDNYGSSLRYASDRLRNDYDIAYKIFKSKSLGLDNLSDKLQTELSLIDYENKEEFFKFAIEFSLESRADKDIMLDVINQHGFLLPVLANNLKDDSDIVLEASKTYKDALLYASKRLKDDKELVLKVIDNHPKALKHASDRLRGDKEVVLKAAKKSSSALRYMIGRLKAEIGDNSPIKYLESQLLQASLSQELTQEKTHSKKLKL